MATIPLPMLGWHTTTVTCRLQSVNSAGLFADAGSDYVLVGVIDGIDIQGAHTTQEISPVTSPRENEVVIYRDPTYVLREIMRVGADNNLLAEIANNASGYDHARLTLTQSGNTTTFYALLGDYEETVVEGKSVAQLPLKMVDVVDATNPTYA